MYNSLAVSQYGKCDSVSVDLPANRVIVKKTEGAS